MSNRPPRQMIKEAVETIGHGKPISNSEIKQYIHTKDQTSALEVSEYLVSECGASAETYSTGRYKIYPDVSRCLDSLEKQGTLRLVKKDYINDRFYHVVQAALSK